MRPARNLFGWCLDCIGLFLPSRYGKYLVRRVRAAVAWHMLDTITCGIQSYGQDQSDGAGFTC